MVNNHIQEVSIYNMWNSNKVRHITFPKNINILTGFNGCGKSTILEIIFTLLSDRNSPVVTVQNWGAKTKLDQNVTAFACDMGYDGELNNNQIDNNSRRLQTPNLDKLSVKSFYEAITFKARKNINEIGTDSTLTIKNENKNRNDRALIKMVHVPKGSPLEGLTLDKIVNPVFYREEVFIIPDKPYANVEKGEKHLFSRNAALDLTLRELLIDFLSFEKDYNDLQNSKVSEIAANDFINNIESYFDGLDQENISVIKNKIVSDWKEKITTIKPLNNRVYDFEKILNGYFSCTEKKASRDSRNMICFTDRNGNIIEWTKLSRGEKNLLVLLLLAFFANNDKKIFILDEPDLSLHIEWQKNILDSMSKLAPNTQFIVATHSPAMLMNGLDFNVININNEINNEQG